MEHAGLGATRLLVEVLQIVEPVAIVCGSGNNGGDGYVVGRHLLGYGYPHRLFSVSEPKTEDAQANADLYAQFGGEIEEVEAIAPLREVVQRGVVVDAMLGTGLSEPLRSPYDEICTAINNGDSRVLALDVPTGLDSDNGVALGNAIRATWTCTFGVLKHGLVAPGARPYCGELYLQPIGLPAASLPPETPTWVGRAVRLRT